MGIYVEVLIQAPIEVLWDHTQDPSLHQRWDLRFSTIRYLPRSDDEPQQFLYATRIGFGLQITGKGESIGQRELSEGRRASSLKFSSEDPRSIIREGSGYWKYIPTPDGIRFLTWYDYRTRFGRAGVLLDRAVFRPLLAWATAWSFDRLRLWLERGVAPNATLRHFVTHACARTTVALVFAYHGLVPKLLIRDADEIAMLQDAGVPSDWLPTALSAAGFAELAFAFVLLLFWRHRWPSVACLVLMLAATVAVIAFSPRYLGAAFNPLTLNLSVAALSLLDLVNLADAPSAARCRYSSRASDL
jgi:DoxX-like family